MLIYDDVNTSSIFDADSDSDSGTSRYKSTLKRKRSHSNRAKSVKCGGRLQQKVKQTRKIRKGGKRVIKKLNVKNLKFLKKLGFKVKRR